MNFNLATHYVDRHVIEGRGDRVALRSDQDLTTYAELAERVNRIGNALLTLGVQPGDRVLMSLADSVDLVASWYAVLKVGAVTAEAYTFLPVKDYAYYLEYTEASVVIADLVTLDRVRQAVAAVASPVKVLVAGGHERSLRSGEYRLAELMDEASATLSPAPTRPDDLAIWKFTTGSTGAPKAAVHRMSSAAISSRAYGQAVLGIQEGDVVLPVPKLFFGYARDLTTLFPFEVGACGVIFPERATADRIFELVERHRATILVNVPTMMNAMVHHPDGASRDMGSLRLSTSAGEALPPELHRRWLDKFGVPVLDGLGSSEAYHVYISNRPGDSRVGSIGRLVPGYSARVVDPLGRDVPDGEPGELLVAGETVAVEYHDAPEKSHRTFEGNLVRTGDLVVRDDSGFFWFRGRSDDLLKVGGIWVAPREIEECLLDHADVKDCAVVGFEADGLTKTRAFVVLASGCAPSDEVASALQDHVRTRLSPHKYPRDVRFLEALPRLPSGKLDRRRLASPDPSDLAKDIS